MLAEITVATRLVIVCNPNNPTSTALPAERIADFVARVPRHVCVLVDEAYCEFNTLDDPDTTLPLLEKHPNLVLLRTFSKIYGLAGLRVGFALCGSAETYRGQPGPPALLLQRRRPGRRDRGPRATRTPSPSASSAPRRAHRDRRRARDLGIEAAESQANFSWLPLPGHDGDDALAIEKQVVDGLAQRGVLVRAGSALGRDGWLRVSYGTPDQNARFLRDLGEILRG